MSKYDSLLPVHPIFRCFKNEIFMHEQCEISTNNGSFQSRYIVFHTAGLFILETKTFQRSLSLSFVIPLISMKSISVQKQSLTIKTKMANFELKLKKQIELAAKMYVVRSVLLGHENLDFSFEINDELRPEFDSYDFDYTPEHIYASRFISILFSNKKVQYNEEIVKMSCDALVNEFTEFTINQPMLNNPYIAEICMSIALGNSVTKLTLELCELDGFIPPLKKFIQYSTSVRTIVFKSVGITQNLAQCKNLFSDPHLIRLDEIVFEKCKILAPDANAFFDSFTQLESNIKQLRVEGCVMTRESLDAIFQSLFFSNCFHSLETLIITDVSLSEDLSGCLFQLLCCGWVLQKRCLNNLTLRNCGLKVNELLNNLKDLDCGILNLELGYNSFLGLPGTLGLHGLSSLILDHCNFSGDMLLHFFSALEKEQLNGPINIDLSYAVADDSSFLSFYQNAPKLKIQNLNGLVWDGNAITSTTIEPFTSFLKKQTNLSVLSISRCIAKQDQQKALPFLIDLVRNKSFEQFCITATKENAFGSPLVGVIESLIHKSQLRILDITGQCIGDIGLFLILREMGPSLEELWFDGFNPTSPDVFLSVCNKVIARQQLKRASWPSSDITPVLSKVHIENRPETLRKIKAVKSTFSKRFGEIIEEDSCRTRINTQIKTEKRSSSTEILPPPLEKDILSNNLKTEKEYISYDEETKKLLEECSSVVGTTPILSTKRNIENAITLASLLTKMKK